MRVGISGLAVSNPSGLGRLSRIYILALALSAPGWELHCYFRSPADLERLKDECDSHTADLPDRLIPHYPPLDGLNRLLLEEWDIPRRLGRLGLGAYLGCDFTLPRRPVAGREFVVLPDMLPFTRPDTVGWRARWLYRRGIRRSVKRRAALLPISPRTAQAFAKVFPDHRGDVRVIGPALSPRQWQLAAKLAAQDYALQVRGSLGSLAAPGPFILSVGVTGRRKNTPLMVRTYRRVVLEGKYRGSLVLVGGDGRYHTAPRRRRLALETVGGMLREGSKSAEIYDIGRVSEHELGQLYRSADLLVSLSTEEGFGFPVLEALAHGTPALVTAGSSMAQIASRGVATTRLDPDECESTLASALGALPLLRQEAASLPEQDFSIERLGRELTEVIGGQTQGPGPA